MRLPPLEPLPIVGDADAQLCAAMLDAGIDPPERGIEWTGRIVRFAPDLLRPRNRSGWYVAHGGARPAAAFGDWRDGATHSWRADTGREFDPIAEAAYRAEIERARAAADVERARYHIERAADCRAEWDSSGPAPADHPYLVRKRIAPDGLRIDSRGRLLCPLYGGPGGSMMSMQRIDADGKKRYVSGAAVAGGLATIGELGRAGTIYVAEGWATAASIHAATGRPVVVAYSAGNLLSVCEQLRARMGDAADICIVGDNDASGTGQRAAQAASDAIGCRVVLPPVEGDANDYALAGHDLAALLSGPPVRRYRLADAVALAHSYVPTPWRIRGLIPSTPDCVAIYGAPNAGKSFLALDMARAIAAGEPWHGRRVKPCAVVYVVLEAAAGFAKRLKAMLEHYGSLPDALKIVHSTPFAFSRPADIAELIAAINDLRDQYPGGVLIIIDTLARAAGELEENDNGDMSRLISSAERIARETNGTTVLIAHPGKDSERGLRGASALLGGLDTLIRVSVDKDSGLRTWSVEKSKEDSADQSGAFDLSVVDLGTDSDGEPITSCVVVQAEMPESETQSVAPAQQKARRQFISAVQAGHGSPWIDSESGKRCPSIRRDGFLAYLESIGTENPATRRSSWARLLADMAGDYDIIEREHANGKESVTRIAIKHELAGNLGPFREAERA